MSDLKIIKAQLHDISLIHHLAHEIWWPAYQHFIPHGQISLMLSNMYSLEALKQQIHNGQLFFIAFSDSKPVGFIGIQPKATDLHILRIEKLYVHPNSHGKGVANKLLITAIEHAQYTNKKILELNVNKNNAKAIAFYTKQAFTITEETLTPYHGYYLDDYVMQKKLT